MEHGQKVILDTLNDIASTLKRIEQKLNAKEHYEVIKEAVSHALQGSKYKTTPKDLVKITEILYQQLQLLAEKSKDKDISAKDLYNISDEIDRLTETIYGLTSD